jgi:orotate phosphoribosyltransferase-like protein
MPKILNKYAVRHILENLNELDRYLEKVKEPNDLYIQWSHINVRTIRNYVLDVIASDIEVEAPDEADAS